MLGDESPSTVFLGGELDSDLVGCGWAARQVCLRDELCKHIFV